MVRGSNSRPSVCKTDALPTELTIHRFVYIQRSFFIVKENFAKEAKKLKNVFVS